MGGCNLSITLRDAVFQAAQLKGKSVQEVAVGKECARGGWEQECGRGALEGKNVQEVAGGKNVDEVAKD